MAKLRKKYGSAPVEDVPFTEVNDGNE